MIDRSVHVLQGMKGLTSVGVQVKSGSGDYIANEQLALRWA